MKILLICHEFPPIGAGAANAAFHCARHFSNGGNEVTVMTSRFKGVEFSKIILNSNIDTIEMKINLCENIISAESKKRKNKFSSAKRYYKLALKNKPGKNEVDYINKVLEELEHKQIEEGSKEW